MKRTVNAMQARQKLGEILEGVFYRGDEVVIERSGKPMGVIIPMERYQSIERARERFFATIDKLRESNRDADSDQIERDIAQAASEARRERRHRRSSSNPVDTALDRDIIGGSRNRR